MPESPTQRCWSRSWRRSPLNFPARRRRHEPVDVGRPHFQGISDLRLHARVIVVLIADTWPGVIEHAISHLIRHVVLAEEGSQRSPEIMRCDVIGFEDRAAQSSHGL